MMMAARRMGPKRVELGRSRKELVHAKAVRFSGESIKHLDLLMRQSGKSEADVFRWALREAARREENAE